MPTKTSRSLQKRLSSDWTKHLKDAKTKGEFESLVRNSTALLSRLRQILQERQSSIQTEESRRDDYDNPSWPYKQANRNGRIAELKYLEDLLDFF